MKKIGFSLFFIFLFGVIYAQSDVVVTTNKKGYKETKVTKTSVCRTGPYTTTAHYKGSFLLFDTFRMGKIKTATGKSFDLPILYNILDESITLQFPTKESTITKTDFSIGDQNFIYREGRYYEMLADGKIKFLKHYNCKLSTPERAAHDMSIGMINGFEGEFETSVTYSFLLANGKLSSFKLTKKSVKNALKEQETTLIEKINSMPDVLTEEDVKKMMVTVL